MKYLLKTSIVSILLLLLFFGCEEIPDGVIVPTSNSFQVIAVTAPDTFSFNPSDSTIRISLKLKGTVMPLKDPLGFLQNSTTRETLVAIWLDNIIKQTDTTGIITATAEGHVKMKEAFPSGNYNLIFQTIDSGSQISTIIAEHKFFYNNGKENFQPEITNLKMYYVAEQPTLRDTVDRNKDIIFSLKVSDANGLSDILKVSFDLFRPDSSSVGNFIMFDNGDAGHGDAAAGDGIFSLKNSFLPTSAVGNWNFIFTAVDNSDSTSNVITHNLYVK